MFISVNNPTLKKNIGKYNLPKIWDRFLSELKIKNQKETQEIQEHNTTPVPSTTGSLVE